MSNCKDDLQSSPECQYHRYHERANRGKSLLPVASLFREVSELLGAPPGDSGGGSSDDGIVEEGAGPCEVGHECEVEERDDRDESKLCAVETE